MGRVDKPAGRPRRLLQVLAGALVALGASCLVGGALAWHASLTQSDRDVVQTEATHVAGVLDGALTRYGDLVATSAQALGSGFLGPAQFHALATGLGAGDRYPAVEAIGFVSYVPGHDLAAFERAHPAPGGGPLTLTPLGARPYYCIGSAGDWTQGTSPQRLLGYDFCSVPWLRAALLGAARSGATTVVSGRTLAAAYAKDFLLIVPFRQPGASGAGPSSIVGWGAALTDGPTLIASAGLASHSPQETTLYAGPRAVPSLLCTSWGTRPATVAGTVTRTLDASGIWTVQVKVGTRFPGVIPAWTAPLILLIAGLLLLGTLVALGVILARSRHRAELSAEQSHLAMARSEARFESLAAASPVGILETDGGLSLTYLNARLESIAGLPAENLLGTTWLEHLHPEDRAEFLARAHEAVEHHSELAVTARFVRPTGETRTLRILAAPVGADATGPGRFVGTVQDVSEEVALHELLRHQAFHDELTGLPNRALFSDRLEQATRQSRRHLGPPAVLFLDVDRFKLVNDSYGHKAGDRLLVELASRLRSCVREGETVTRLGGDEFAVLLPEVTDLQSAIAVAERILGVLGEPFDLEGRPIVVSMSIGIALADRGSEPDTTLRSADAAMYRAKQNGGADYAVFDERLYRQSLARLTIEADLRLALQRDEFEVYFQPVIDLATGEPFGAEALLRWHHPRYGLLSPESFMAVAEDSGLIVPIGQWAFGAAVAQVEKWDTDPQGPSLGMVAINFSSRQLRSSHLSRERRALLELHRVDPSRICVEVTETVVMDDNEDTRRTLELMTGAGVKVAIDDFGTGYSSLAYLQRLPVTTLKVDRRFIAGVGEDPAADAIVTAIAEMAHRLGKSVVAEGVETDRQRVAITAMGCDAAQGYLWARPLSPVEFGGWWRGARLATILR